MTILSYFVKQGSGQSRPQELRDKHETQSFQGNIAHLFVQTNGSSSMSLRGYSTAFTHPRLMATQIRVPTFTYTDPSSMPCFILSPHPCSLPSRRASHRNA